MRGSVSGRQERALGPKARPLLGIHGLRNSIPGAGEIEKATMWIKRHSQEGLVKRLAF